MAETELVAITKASLSLLHVRASLSLFWELGPESARKVEEAGNSFFEKEAWLATTLYEYGPCGFSILVPGYGPGGLDTTVRATVLYSSRDVAPGALAMPTGPVSKDAEVITSLYLSPGFEGLGMEAVLLDAAIMDLSKRGATAVEAFGLVADGTPPDEDSANIVERAEDIGLLDVDDLLAAGFEVIAGHPVLPRLRLELPPAQGALTAAAVAELLAGIPVGAG